MITILIKFNSKKSFKTWIFTIAKNTCIDWLKKKKTIPFSEFEDEIGKNKFNEMFIDQRSLADRIFGIDKLSPKYRLVLSLYYNDNLNFREISEILGEPLNTIKSRHRRALTILRKHLI